MDGVESQRFEIISKLGEGEMGVVYEAYDREREVRLALKALRHVDAWSLYRFKREFRALRDLSHPNVVTLYELCSEDNQWFLLMELTAGVDFLAYVRGASRKRMDTPLPFAMQVPSGRPTTGRIESPDKLEKALRQLANALDALHSIGIIHRDLKPENVLVTRDGRVVLMDFGIIVELRRPLDQAAGQGAMGTPVYMAPEQVVGSPASVAADWYAFGVMLYEALTGRAPYVGGHAQVMDNKQLRDPMLPSDLVGKLPGHLEELCMRLLAREVQDRAGFPEVVAALGMAEPTRDATVALVADSDVFVGRREELDTLRSACGDALHGRGQCVFVQGPSGIGKTALLDRFIDELEATQPQPLILAARCHENESLAYKAFDGAIDELSNYLMRQSDAARESLLPRDARAIAQLFPTLSQVPGCWVASGSQDGGGRASRDAAVSALEELLGAFARERTVVLRIEDLHWADRDSLELLQDLLRPAAPSGLLILATIRTASLDADCDPRLERAIELLSEGGSCHRVRMGPLGTSDQQELRRQLSRCGLQLQNLDDELWREAAGHPMLLAELAHYAQGLSGELEEPGELDLRDLNDVVWLRVERLPDKVRALIELVAVAGEPTPLWVLGKAAGLSNIEREGAASVLRIARLVRQVPRPHNEVWIEPYHDKVRESVTRHLAVERNRELHGRLARVLEESADVPPARLGRHFAAAAMMREAVKHTVQGARAAARQLAFERAHELYRRALDWIEDLSGAGLELELERCQAQVGLAECLRIADRYDDALVQLERAKTLAEAHHFRSELATIHYLFGNVCFRRLDIEGCLREHRLAHSLARDLESARLEARALAGQADAEYLRGRMLSSFRYFDQCVNLCQKHGLTDIEVANLGARGFAWQCQNNLTQALKDCQDALTKAAKLGYSRAEALIRGNWLANVYLEMGDLETAASETLRSLTLVRELRLALFESYQVATLGRIRFFQGRFAEAERLAQDAVALTRETKKMGINGPICLGILALATSEPVVRRDAINEALAILEAGSFGHYMWFYREAIDATLRSGAYDETLRHAQAFEDFTRPEPFPWSRFVIERGRALAEHGRGKRDSETMSAIERLRREALSNGLVTASQALVAAVDGT